MEKENKKDNRTLAMIKPDAVEDKNVGAIISIIEQSGFTIRDMRLTKLSRLSASTFYYMHIGKPFHKQMCDFIASGPIVVLSLEKENAVAEFRKLLGATDPAEAAENTLRKKFGKSIDHNAVHGSDTNSAADMELMFFFPKLPDLDNMDMSTPAMPKSGESKE